MEAHLIKHALRVAAGGLDRYDPQGWYPKLRVTVMGPTPSDTELVWTMYKPDGSTWFEHGVSMPELEDEEMHDALLQKWGDDIEVDQDGVFRFTVHLVNELDDVDIVLHDGTMSVVRVGDSKVFAIDNSSLLRTGLVGLDVYDEHDAPKIRATVFLGGISDTNDVDAHMFYNGKRFTKASYVSNGFDFSRSTGDTVATECIAEFDNVRGWNNLRHQSWGNEEWHYLDRNDGLYEIKFTRSGKINRTMSFEVADGRIVKDDVIEPDVACRPTMWRVAEIVGDFEGDAVTDPSASRGYADMETSSVDYSSDGMYWFRNADVVEEQPEFDEETTAAVESVCGQATNLLYTWEETMLGGRDRNDSMYSNFVLQCEVVAMNVGTFETSYSALDGVADEHLVDFRGETTNLAEIVQRVLALRATANSHIGAADDAVVAELAPYRAVLANDKLTIFEDHPANAFRYYTENKHVIQTPEELASASLWFFEGSSDTEAAGSVDGHSVKATMTGWRVLGYVFDDNGVMIDEFETRGGGSSAPRSAFVAR